jgi:L-cysteine S-thiosulfotransferase
MRTTFLDYLQDSANLSAIIYNDNDCDTGYQNGRGLAFCFSRLFTARMPSSIPSSPYLIRKGLLLLVLLTAAPLLADPLQDQHDLKTFYQQRFPKFTPHNYADGVYALDPIARDSWEAIEEFPPYEPALEAGEQAFNTPFANGKSYADCFPNKGIGIANEYPKWDANQAQVITLAFAINQCRIANGETPLPYKRGPITELLAYMAHTAAGKPANITVPAADPKALAAYEQGKQYYYQRRGQLNFACATCHVDNAGKKIRAETLSPMIGHTSGWPVYRLKWGEMGTLHRRFIGCHKQIRAKPLPAQSQQFRNLEYFMSYMSNGIPLNGPSTRK